MRAVARAAGTNTPSVYRRFKDRRALLRALLDNAYLANNPRTEVSETHATTETLDDLLVSRLGGIVLWLDESGISSTAELSTTWTITGNTPVLPKTTAQAFAQRITVRGTVTIN